MFVNKEDDNIELKPLSSRRPTVDDVTGPKDKSDEAMERIMDDWVPDRHAAPDRCSVDSEGGGGGNSGPRTPLRQFLWAINPINMDDWPEMNLHGKIYEVCKVIFKKNVFNKLTVKMN